MLLLGDIVMATTLEVIQTGGGVPYLHQNWAKTAPNVDSFPTEIRTKDTPGKRGHYTMTSQVLSLDTRCNYY